MKPGARNTQFGSPMWVAGPQLPELSSGAFGACISRKQEWEAEREFDPRHSNMGSRYLKSSAFTCGQWSPECRVQGLEGSGV